MFAPAVKTGTDTRCQSPHEARSRYDCCTIAKAMGKKSRLKRERRNFLGPKEAQDNDLRAKPATTDPETENIIAVAKSFIAICAPHSGACYRCAFFLRLFLKERFSYEGEAVVGFVNDGTDDLYPSHAWYEFKDQLTDLAISQPLHPEVQPAGPLTIQGICFFPGHEYSYHRERPVMALVTMGEMIKDPSVGHIIQQNEEQHMMLHATSKNDSLIRAFLDQAPDGWTYKRTAAAVSQGLEKS